jgi:peptidoglycan-associated lipoprotein
LPDNYKFISLLTGRNELKQKRILPLSLIVASLLSLSACHGTKNNANATAGVDNDLMQATPYAVNSKAQYANLQKTTSTGEKVNALKAPSNQTYYFDVAKNTVNTKDYEALTVQAIYLSSHPTAKVRLEGNTDNRGSREYNVALAWRRDQSVLQLLKQQGVAPSQIKSISYGKEHPAVYGNNDYAWRLNRRVNLVYEAY